ncbi:MAG: hypothetical protein LIR50_06620 [Bacillota bacterium]|nr:hypothetical protein [Bacillota bacterium]
MPQKNYSRYFIILQEDEKNFALSQDKLPSGYTKLENKNDKCKITFYVQNLSKEKKPYCQVLICGKKGKKQIVNLGTLNIDDTGRCETSIEYGENNIGNMNIPMKEIVGAAVIKSTEPSVISVMSGFLSTNIADWKSYQVVDTGSGERIKNEFDSYEEKIEGNKEENIVAEAEVKNEEPEVHEREPEVQAENKKDEFIIDEDSAYLFFRDIVSDFEEVKVCPEIDRIKFYKIPVTSIEDMINCDNYNKYTVIYYPVINYFTYIKDHGYYLFGLKFNKEGRLKYLDYAIPGENEKRCQPFSGRSGFVTWVSEDGSDSGDGYWMMFYDFKNKSIVVPVK